MSATRPPLAAAAAFFLSGVAALVYQVSWQRILALHSGVGIYSVAIIVAAFMAGLGLGSHLGGVGSARLTPPRALRAFGVLELGIALFGAASAWIYYDWLYARAAWMYSPLWRAALLHLLGLALPTILMGMSLPFLVRAAVRRVDTAGAVVGALYAVNLLGAATGAALTPWLLIRVWGMRGALLAAAGCNLAAAVIVLAAGRQRVDGEAGAAAAMDTAATEVPSVPAADALPLAGWGALYALGGLCALSLEILWFRITDVALKATSFTFGTVLAVYLGGMALGTFVGVRTVHRLRRPLPVFLAAQCALLAWAGASAIALARLPTGTPLYAGLVEYWSAPRPFNLGGDWNPAAFFTLYVLLPVALYGPPTALMGFSFTVLQRAVHDDPRTSGRKVGFLQACNIAGCVAGSLLVGLGTLGWWGTTGTLRAILLLGLVFVAVWVRAAGLTLITGASGAVLIALAALVPDPSTLWMRLHGVPPSAGMVEEDATGMAALIPAGPRWSLWVNGRTNSSLPFGGFHTLLGAVPAVIHPAPEQIAIVGLGSGDTAWAAATRRETRHVSVYEICAPQITLLHRLAATPEGPARLAAFLRDPRIVTRVADGRNGIALGGARWDVIEMDALFPSSPYSGNLYSYEFFAMCARRLRKGGVMCSWSPKPRVRATFRAAFPHVIEMRQGQLVVGSNEPLPVDIAAWTARAAAPEIAAYLGANNVRKLMEALATARIAEGPIDRGDLNHDLFPRDEFKGGETEP